MAKPTTTGTDPERLNVFVSYSHKDKRWLDRLQIHLAPLTREYALDVWDDTRIRPGSRWREEIRVAIARSNAAILIVSADFLASDFIHTDELPPLLKAAEEDGALILIVLASPSMFSRNPNLSQFQAVNPPSRSLVDMTEGEQEMVLLQIAEAIHDKVQALPRRTDPPAPASTTHERFLEHRTWLELLRLGDWIFDEEAGKIIGSGVKAYLLSRNEYGDTPFQIVADLKFKNIAPTDGPARMNAGLIFGWQSGKGVYRYLNVLFTGSEVIIERVGFRGGSDSRDYEHITPRAPLEIESGRSYETMLRVTEASIEILVDGRSLHKLPRPTGVMGRVGLRPWRSQLECTRFIVEATDAP